MSVSKTWVKTYGPEAVRKYKADDKPTLEDLAEALNTTYQNVRAAVREGLTDEEYRAEKALRYSRSKAGSLNPMQGKNGSLHHGYKGSVPDGRGYLTEPQDGGRVFQHRQVMAEALGLPMLPETLHVHHIDGDKSNNDLDNLALVTPRGHRRLHRTKPESQRSPLWHQWVSGTSRSEDITPTPLKDS